MPPNRSATYFTPAPKYNPKGLSANDTALYTRGYHDAMKAVQHGVVWIEGKTYSQIPMYLPDPLEWNQPHDGRREPHDRHPSVDRSYSRPQPIWDERDVKRENLGPYGPSRSHSDPVPRLGVAPYPPDFYRPSAPPGYGYPPQMEPGPPHYPVHMSGPPMGPYMGGEYGPRYYPVPMRPPGQQMRSRQQISCHPCRNRKVKCSGTTPCEACIKIKREHECVYEKTVRRRGKGKKAGTTTDENGDSKPDTGEEGQSEDDRRDVSTSPSRGRMDFERRVDDRERRDEDEGERVSRSADRKRPHSRSRSPRRRSALGPRHQRDSP
ncbi:hypothetical protein CcaverHIS002_0402200 [Cutaneotrichosporon cavernicola]|uniref:Zn(2)-C6 fungal-type domain-containing protein n=1 Tax=Cutaneotrichosporon cavernicola TaxID=279322 RepID=A0AA48QVK5_9TREE|nr:uncharacterized protein CcaverHIS019_0402160 [Cutaneotrichosporon cavernicola]BEI83616.1 hypothetical protein CcaverHIS002_0402200 [Cutaneotrichosporon cavernicola]BEI91396.1 hypothetical protein CcaverHIS019_0402160 [Cutaneotrichosporon cavernicola]BEI99170.1 hypothetical protein CcaverHIS631_0402130 [Cutaneotrichosporon cavernicola]BEJ06946.1 hypothetical protein CcaverHIS641_0402150 [Cutaneotrichosporon cavernicola]